jgi:hypothetical protein
MNICHFQKTPVNPSPISSYSNSSPLVSHPSQPVIPITFPPNLAQPLFTPSSLLYILYAPTLPTTVACAVGTCLTQHSCMDLPEPPQPPFPDPWLEGPPKTTKRHSIPTHQEDKPTIHSLPTHQLLLFHSYHHAIDFFQKYSPQGTHLSHRGLPCLLWTPQRP